jgi:histidine triad (HIT) family protein
MLSFLIEQGNSRRMDFPFYKGNKGGNGMTNDFYCDEVLSGKTEVKRVMETENVLAYHHTRPFYPVHIVAIPKRHVSSLITLEDSDDELLLELMGVIRKVAAMVTEEHGACRVITNLGNYQDSKHLHWHVVSGKPLEG